MCHRPTTLNKVHKAGEKVSELKYPGMQVSSKVGMEKYITRTEDAFQISEKRRKEADKKRKESDRKRKEAERKTQESERRYQEVRKCFGSFWYLVIVDLHE